MFSTTTIQTTKTTTTITAQAELAAFSSETGCPVRKSTEPVDPRYAHSAALGRRCQDTSYKRASRCQDCTRPLSAAWPSRFCKECDPSITSGDLWSAPADRGTAVEESKASLQQKQPQTKENSSYQRSGVNLWDDELSNPKTPVGVVSATASEVSAGEDNAVPDEWDAEDD